jgi:hypothetical protein
VEGVLVLEQLVDEQVVGLVDVAAPAALRVAKAACME